MRETLVRIFYRVLSIFPLITGALLGVVVVLGFIDRQHYLLPELGMRAPSFGCIALLFVGILLVLFLLRSKGIRLSSVQGAIAIIIVAASGVLLRVAYLHIVGFQVEPFSDYQWAYETALGSKDYYFHYAIFPSWGFYSICIHGMLELLGTTYISIQIANAVVAGLTLLAIAILVWHITRDCIVAVFAELLFALSPTSVAFVQMLTPEIPAILLECTALVFIIYGLNTVGKARSMVFCAMAGLILGIAEMLKPISPIVLIAFLLTIVFFLGRERKPIGSDIDEDFYFNMDGEGSRFKPSILIPDCKSLIMLVLSVVLIGVCYSGVKCALTGYLEDNYGEPMATSSVPHFLFVGLQPDGEGQIHLGANNHWSLQVYEAHGYDFDAANEEIMEKVKADFFGNIDTMPRLFVAKTRWAWQTDASVYQVAQGQLGNSPLLVFSASASQWFYIAVMLFAAIGAWGMGSRRLGICGLDKANQAGLFLITAVIFGFALMLLIGEAQSRYKVMVMPYIYFISVLGIDLAVSILLSRFRLCK